MDLNQLKIFAKVVEKRSFTGAANALGLTKTTVSRKISELENRVGVQLLNRTTRKVSPTPQGASFYQNIATAFDEMLNAEQQLVAEQYLDIGTISLLIPQELNNVFSAAIFASFIAEHPDIDIDIQFANRIPDHLPEAGIDLAFHFDASHNKQLASVKLLNFNRRLVASPDYLAKHGIPLTPATLNHHDYIDCLPHQSQSQNGELTMFDGNQWLTVTPKVKLTMDSAQMAKELAINGVGITALPEALAEAAVAQGNLVTVLDDYPLQNHILHLSYPRQSPMPSRCLLFIRHLYRMLSIDFADEVLEVPEVIKATQAKMPPLPQRLAG